MTVTTTRRSGRDAPASPTAPSWLASVRAAVDRPLTSYHLVLGVSALLLTLGLVMVLSASSVTSYQTYGSSYYVFAKQAAWAAIGLPLAWIASRLPIRVIRWFSYPALLLAVALIALTYVPGIGVSVNGNQNWLSFGGPITIQPSEIAKLALVLWVADLYARKEKLLGQTRHLLIPMIPVSLLVAMMVVAQHDLGTALVLFAIIIGLFWVSGASLRLFTAAVLTFACLAAFLAASDPERVGRLMGFLDPFADMQRSGYQAAHGLMALASGQFWGLGLGASRQKWGTLPEAHTDFIFAVIGEELGLFGALCVLALFALLAWAGLRIAERTTEPFARFAAAGITVWLLTQAIVNVGMVLGVLPVIGIPLPLISYGGSALVPTMVALGLLVNFAKTESGAKRALAARRRSPRRTAQSPRRR
ncbi:MAG: putative lipid II flippase FtsW [Nocardioidaceae bacterium]